MGGSRKALRRYFVVLTSATTLAASSVAAGHELDHPAQSFTSPGSPPSSESNAGGPGAKWDLIQTIFTGNPHTDLDFFTQGANTYASVGTLGNGPNAGGQTIVQLAEGPTVAKRTIKPVSAHPSASCISDPSAALGLQHDVEATPKGSAILNVTNPFAVTTDTQLLIDATDNEGRCHDQLALGLSPQDPQGGLEIVDITDRTKPEEIGLIRHIGEAHTVNVDPKRPHIAYAVSSDAVGVSKDTSDIDGDGDEDELIRQNETATTTGGLPNADRLDLDGFEVIDLSSCMNFPAGTSFETKRAQCRPQVYRYRWPTLEMALGHTVRNAVNGCHELEVYPNDLLTCGSVSTLIVLDMSGAFNDMGTPDVFTDDKPNGTPLSCRQGIASASTPSPAAPFATGAKVTDCVDGPADGDGDGKPEDAVPKEDLNIPNWLKGGAPSLLGVEYLGTVHHQGREGSLPSTEDIDVNHEAELSASGRLLIATDERGGGVTPPGASCTPGADNPAGNGGVHFFRFDGLTTTGPGPTGPAAATNAHKAYAQTPDGKKAIFRAAIHTQPQADLCTAHVFQQIPGQNRIFTGWYTQGTQVVDFLEHPDGTVELKSAGFFIPENANTWTSAVFKVGQNNDGTFTYWGATGDFNLGTAGRNATDVYRVTLPPPPSPLVTAGEPGPIPPQPGGEPEPTPEPPPGVPRGRCSNPVFGTRANDTLTGSNFSDHIRGNAGRDRIKAGRGADCVFGEKGRDSLRGGRGADRVQGGKDSDRINGGKGNDRLKGGASGDKVNGRGGNDLIKVRDGTRDTVRCGPQGDKVVADKRDRLRGCERVKVA